MRPCMQVLLFTILVAPVAAQAQTQGSDTVQHSELSVILEPEDIVGGMPQAFSFHLVNVGPKDLRIPEPSLDCSNATANGSLWLNESWQPPVGNGLGKGSGICDFGGSGLPSPPITELARKWRLLKPGQSLYIRATRVQLHYEATKPGLYTFSAVYFPPLLGRQEVQLLNEAGIAVPRLKAASASVQYRRGDR
jgi:hypothetical protein